MEPDSGAKWQIADDAALAAASEIMGRGLLDHDDLTLASGISHVASFHVYLRPHLAAAFDKLGYFKAAWDLKR